MADDDKTQIVAPPDPVTVGTQLSGTYELDKRIASGGMGEVYRGHNIQTGDPVAIKIVLPEFARDATILSLFRKEASVLNHLFHEAIVRYHVFAIDQKIGRPYLAMEFVDGKSLADMFADGPMHPEDARKLLIRLASGLAVAHEAGVIHRDLSPDNIVLPDGKVDRAKIIDFGIARSAKVGGETLLGGSFAGKYNFVSPEQLGMAGGLITERSDIYSLGLVIAAALRGKSINMTGSQVDVIEKRRTVPDLSGIDTRLRPVLEAMLQPDPRNRPATMAEIAEGLRQTTPRPRNVWDAEPTQTLAEPAGPPSAAMTSLPGSGGEESWAVTSRTPAPWKLTDNGIGSTSGRTTSPGDASPDTSFPSRTQAGGRRSGGLGWVLVVLLAVAGAGGAGAYFGGYLDGFVKPNQVDAPSQPEPAPQPSPLPADEATPPASDQAAPADDAQPALPEPPPVSQPPAGEVPPEAVDQPAGSMPPAADLPSGSPPAAADQPAVGQPDAEPPAAGPPSTGQPETALPPAADQPPAPVEPQPGPEPSLPPDTAPPSGPLPQEPAVQAPSPAPDPVAPVPPAADDEQAGQQPPSPDAQRSAARHAWLKAFAGGECFYASALPDVGEKLQIVGFGKSVGPFEAMLDAFKATFAADPEPDIGVRLIAPQQCPATDLMRRLDASSANAPEIALTRDVLFQGDALEGHVGLQPGRETYLLLIDHDGIAHNLGSLLKKTADRANFSVQLGLGADSSIGKAPLPQVLLAISSEAPIVALQASKAVPAADLLPRITGELRAANIEAAASASYFRIRG